MDKKNKELIRKNAELLNEISKINNEHSEFVKFNVKKDFQYGRIYNRILDDLEIQVKELSLLLENTNKLKDNFIKWKELTSNVLKEKDINKIDTKTKAPLSKNATIKRAKKNTRSKFCK